MFETIRSFLPTEWHRTIEFLGTPIWWIPQWQIEVINFAWYGDGVFGVASKRIFLMLPILLVVVALWTTTLSLYTLPFRSARGKFMTTIALGWWDTGRGIWLYWAGLIRFAISALGWLWSLVVLAVKVIATAVKQAVGSPFALFAWGSRKYFRPGVPWLAVILTLIWSGLEATIFSFTLMPTIHEVLADITGFEPNRFLMLPVLWLFLFFLILGSFASIQVMNEAFHSRQMGRVIQMVVVEFFVAFFEVVFLYRELIDAITPWIAQQSGGQVQLGLFSTLALGVFGWVGIRGMTWFLFGRFGTPAIQAVLSRQVPASEGAPLTPAVQQAAAVNVWRGPIEAFKSESKWFKDEATKLFELASLPVLQLLAVAVNFPVVALRSQPVFRFPFRNLDEMLADTPFPKLSTRSKQNRAEDREAAHGEGVVL